MTEIEIIKLALTTVSDALHESEKAGETGKAEKLDLAYEWLCEKYLEVKPLKRKPK